MEGVSRERVPPTSGDRRSPGGPHYCKPGGWDGESGGDMLIHVHVHTL